MDEEYYQKAFRGFFVKGLIHFTLLILAMYGIMIVITGGAFHFSFISISIFSYVIIYVMTHKVRRKNLEIDSKERFVQELKDGVAYLHYDIVKENSDLLVIKPQWHERAYTAKLFIELRDREVTFIGVSQHIYKILEAYETQHQRKDRIEQ